MPTDKPVRMTDAQYLALGSANDDGRLTSTDRRTMTTLARRGWVREERKKKKIWWTITEAGQQAYTSSPEVIPQRQRPWWRPAWEPTRVVTGGYLVEGHAIFQPARGMLWCIHCPDRAPDKPVGYGENLADAVEILASHLYGITGTARDEPSCAVGRSTGLPPRFHATDRPAEARAQDAGSGAS